MERTPKADQIKRAITKHVYLIVGAIGLIAIVVNALQQRALPESLADRAAASTPSSGSSEWNAFRYTYQWTDEGFVVSFTPFLPRNDDVVVGAMRHIAEQHFNLKKTRPPSLMRDDDRTFIVLTDDSITVTFLPIKEDSGEVHSFVVRRR